MYACMHTYIHTYIHACSLGGKSRAPRSFRLMCAAYIIKLMILLRESNMES